MMVVKAHGYFQRVVSVLIFIAILLASLLPLADGGFVHAYGLVTSRSIEMSDSTQNASGVSYLVTFSPVTTGTTVQGVIVDFCSTSPIIGDTCTVPTSFTVGTPTISGFTIPGESGGSWTAASLNSGRTLEITNGSATGTPSGSAASFTLTTAHNPNTTNTTFYARILTFDTTGHTGSYTDTGTNIGLLDAGGIALSTANNITITAKVQETLTFCIYTTGGPCGTGNTVTLGDTHGVLSTAGPFVDKSTLYDVATNASSGVAIRVKGDTLKTGSNSITAIGATAAKSATGTSQFGFCTYKSSGASGLTPVTLYDGTGTGFGGGSGDCSTTTQTAGTGSTGGNGSGGTEPYFGFDATNTSSTYGQVFANKTAGASSTGTIAFIGNISTTQQAGIYTTTLIFVATGTY